MSFESNESVAEELALFTENDGDIYRRQTEPILKNLATKKASGKYDHDKAAQLFMYLTETGAREYIKQHGSPEDVWHQMFPINVRRIVATKWRDEFEQEFALGNYDHLIPKKYQNPSRIYLKKPHTCPLCRGSGSESRGVRCSMCGGAGTLS